MTWLEQHSKDEKTRVYAVSLWVLSNFRCTILLLEHWVKWHPCVYTIPLTLGWGVERRWGQGLDRRRNWRLGRYPQATTEEAELICSTPQGRLGENYRRGHGHREGIHTGPELLQGLRKQCEDLVSSTNPDGFGPDTRSLAPAAGHPPRGMPSYTSYSCSTGSCNPFPGPQKLGTAK